MGIMLGNLTTKDIEKRLGINLATEERQRMERSRQSNASGIKSNKWHCFDLPLMVVCGSAEVAGMFREILTPFQSEMNESIQIGIDTSGN